MKKAEEKPKSSGKSKKTLKIIDKPIDYTKYLKGIEKKRKRKDHMNSVRLLCKLQVLLLQKLMLIK